MVVEHKTAVAAGVTSTVTEELALEGVAQKTEVIRLTVDPNGRLMNRDGTP